MTTQWTDMRGRVWSTELTVGTIARVRQLAGVNLLAILEDTRVLDQLLDDPVAFASTLWAVSKPQAVERGIDEEQFAELLVGEVTAQAVTALVEGILGFFQPPRRDLLRQVWTKIRAARTAAVELSRTKVDSPALDQAIQQALAAASTAIDQRLSALGKSSTNSPESSASIPVPTAGANSSGWLAPDAPTTGPKPRSC